MASPAGASAAASALASQSAPVQSTSAYEVNPAMAAHPPMDMLVTKIAATARAPLTLSEKVQALVLPR